MKPAKKKAMYSEWVKLGLVGDGLAIGFCEWAVQKCFKMWNKRRTGYKWIFQADGFSSKQFTTRQLLKIYKDEVKKSK